MICFDKYLFTCVASEVRVSAKFMNNYIFEVTQVKLIPHFSNTALIEKEYEQFKLGIERLLSSGFYFSETLDLSRSMQKQNSSQTSEPDSRYIWNTHMLKDFTLQGTNLKPWTCNLIQGHCESIEVPYRSSFMNQLLISRRRTDMSGTRYNARGIDELGNAANYVETEVIYHF